MPALAAPDRRTDQRQRTALQRPARTRHGHAKRERKKACAQEFGPAIEAEIARFVAPGTAKQLDFEALETHVRRQALQLAARYAGRHPKTFETALTAMTLERAYYHCPRCRQGFYPRDRALGMARSGLSPAVTRITGATAALVSFARASGLLADLAGVFPCEPPAAVTMYLGMDGTGVPMRPTEVAGRAGKQADGSAKTREAKLVLVWTAEDRDKHGHPRCDAGSVTYSAAIESAASRDTDPDPSEFARRVRREAERRGFQLARRRVILGDGAKWIWQVATEMFPGAIQIVDYFHACEKVWQVARAVSWPASAPPTSSATATACATRTSVPRACKSVPAWWKAAARMWSADA